MLNINRYRELLLFVRYQVSDGIQEAIDLKWTEHDASHSRILPQFGSLGGILRVPDVDYRWSSQGPLVGECVGTADQTVEQLPVEDGQVQPEDVEIVVLLQRQLETIFSIWSGNEIAVLESFERFADQAQCSRVWMNDKYARFA